MEAPFWDKIPTPAKNSIRGFVWLAVLGFASYWGAQEAVKKTIKEDWFTSDVVEELNSNIVGSASHAYFYMGRENDDPEYRIVFYVSRNQEVELLIKAKHYGSDELRKIQVLVGGRPVKAANISGSSDYQKIIPLTAPVHEVMAEGPHDFSKNIQKVEFRMDPLQETTNYVSIEALVKTIGIPKRLHRGGNNE